MNYWTILIAVATMLVIPASGQNASQILEGARIAATLQNNDLQGTIRKGRQKTPVSLFLRGKDIQFTTGAGEERFHMRLGDGKFDLFEILNGKTVRFPQAKLAQSIAGTDLTYEDLSFRFFYWPNPIMEGSERVGVHDCWKIRLNNPGKGGNYRVIYVWVHKKFGAFMKVEGFDVKGSPLKRFTVDEVMKLPDDTYTLKKMTVSSFAGGRTTGNSYLEFKKPPKKAPGGVR